MSESTDKSWLLSGVQYVGAWLCVPALYVLSTGPIAGLSACGVIPVRMALLLDQTFYAPLVWVLESSPMICDLMARYESLFVP